MLTRASPDLPFQKHDWSVLSVPPTEIKLIISSAEDLAVAQAFRLPVLTTCAALHSAVSYPEACCIRKLVELSWRGLTPGPGQGEAGAAIQSPRDAAQEAARWVPARPAADQLLT